MFGLGMMEIGLIIVLAVMLFPPKELPKLARSIARVYGQVRKTAEDFRNTVLEDEDLREPIDEIKGAYNDARWEIRDAERKARQQLAKAQMEMRMATARRIQADKEAEQQAEIQPAETQQGDRANAAPAGPAVLAKDDDEIDDGPIAASDPRKIASARAVAYTPPSADAADGEEPREGVA